MRLNDFSVKEAARLAKVDERTIRRAIASGKLVAVRLSERRKRIPGQHLNSWLENRGS